MPMRKIPPLGVLSLSAMEREQQTPSDLRALISDAGMSQAELARKIDTNESQMSRYVNGLKPGPHMKRRIAKSLGVSEEEIKWGN